MSEGAARELAILSELNRILAEATNVSQVKDLRDKAEAIRKYAKDARLGLELQNQAAEAKLRAERRAGEMLSGMRLHDGNPWLHDATRLVDLGIEKTQSHRWQRLAAVPEAVFEGYLSTARGAHIEITAAGLLRSRTTTSVSSPTTSVKAAAVAAADRKGRRVHALEREGLDEALQHCRQLLSMLLPLCDDERHTLNRAERRLAIRLLRELQALLADAAR